MTNPWSGRFTESPVEAFLHFSQSLTEDVHLLRDDVVGSLAHAQGLARAGVLTDAEADRIARGLRRVLQRLEAGDAKLRVELEDVHMNVEVLLRDEVGELAGKLHTARSRNDQVALDLRLFTRRGLLDLAAGLLDLAAGLLAKAEAHADLPMPGFTHLQPAMPVTFGHALHAHAERALRDAERALDAFNRANVSPLGAAALAGTSFPIDPAWVAERLAFDAAFANSLDAVSDRDFAAEASFVAGLVAAHLSGLGEELVIHTSPAFGYVRLGETLTTGSSIMPQKRNPDAAELLRGRAGPAFADAQAILATLKALPLAYNRDLQETKAPLLRALPRGIESVHLARLLVESLEPVPDRMAGALSTGYPEATEYADWLVQQGVPFREAHHVVGSLVKEAERQGVPLHEVAAGHPSFAAADLAAFAPERVAARKTSPGGSAPERVREAVAAARDRLDALRRDVDARAGRIRRAEAALLAPGS